MTHLVSNKPGGNKYTHAKDWGLAVVHMDWVVASLKAGRRLDERPYSLDSYDPSRGPAAEGAPATSCAVDAGRLGRTNSSTRCAASVDAATGVVNAGQPGASIKGVVGPGGGNTGLGLARGGSAALGAGGPARPPPGPSYCGGEATWDQPQYLAAQPQPQQLQPRALALPAEPPDDCYFLHWVRMYVVGVSPIEQPQVLAAIRESGATREPALLGAGGGGGGAGGAPPGHGVVTHIVFGSLLSVGEMAEVRQYLGEFREQVRLCKLDWLFECVNRRTYIEPEGRNAVTEKQLQTWISGGPAPTAAAAAGPGGAGRGARSREPSPAAGPGLAVAASGVPALDDYVPLDGDGNTRTMDSFAVRVGNGGGGGGPAGVFSGLWFTLAAVAGSEEEAPATKLVRQGGGMVISASTDKTVRDPQKRFAVCPFSLPQSLVDRLSARGRDRGPTEFERVTPEQRVTVAWLKACLGRGELLPVHRLTPLFRPLPHALPLPGFQGVTVAVSQFHPEQRDVLKTLIERLGGTCTDKLNKRCHYLVIQYAKGDKFVAAVKWGIPCVNATWVLESAYQGRPLVEVMAFLPSEITPQEMEEKKREAAARSGGGGTASQMGLASQHMGGLGPTQRPEGGQAHTTSTGAFGGAPRGIAGPAAPGAPKSMLASILADLGDATPPQPQPPHRSAAAAGGADADAPAAASTKEAGQLKPLPVHKVDKLPLAPTGAPLPLAAAAAAAAEMGGATGGQAEQLHQPQEQGQPAVVEDDSPPDHAGAAASLMNFLHSNAVAMPEMACSQLEMPMLLPVLGLPSGLGGGGPTGSESSMGGGAASSEPSRQLGTMKPPEDSITGAVTGVGRRSRKRNAAAAEATGVPSNKAVALPGRRGRNDEEEEEGFGVAMSQQVGYEAASLTSAPTRATRSSARLGRGGQGADAKENLIKAVQGNLK
ncbi:hypothetical protein HXX76_000224 [Chlamydomonas incerta]|uniref:BRCT domain-containing protein n=1 Tax=Chlamydomonas incerta TaxID=51695 RepID=A0A836B2R6_CHLIN|nr:hypothetical protein HXX76_000224 [Chlamydomonas incerta]|eukprot:KAG2445614.1 hypothetical protein HXX76_000224 [Chlamydomonas incerta]